MHDTLESSVSMLKSYKACRMRTTAIMLALSLLVSLNVLFVLRQQGITMAGDADCGIVEHTHDEECFADRLVCDIAEEEHSHIDECYKTICICEEDEHIHTALCYSDENADVETQLDWQEMYQDYSGENLRENLINIAQMQIGYTESERNYSVDENGNRKGYTRYGAWYGMPYGDWSAMFVSFCMNYAGLDTERTPFNIGADTMLLQWQSAGLFADAQNYDPTAGDLIFFADNTVGIVSSVNYDALEVIRGDVENAVAQLTVMDYDSGILGYGIIPDGTRNEDEPNTEKDDEPATYSEGGECISDTNWIELRDSGFFTYWEQFLTDEVGTAALTDNIATYSTSSLNEEQIDKYGDYTVSDDGKVTVSKTISGTEIENVFDITLTVETQENIESIYEEPNMAVVIVMDISNTMNKNFGGTTRYAAAVEAAEKFVDEFAEETNGISKIGYVAFNSDAHKIFDLSSCSTDAEAVLLKNQMRQETGNIINASGYAQSQTRFTNIEAGLKMAEDMLSGVNNQNKYVIFLSDGFPTTYISSGYTGYDTFTPSGTIGSDGVFHDDVRGVYCRYGTDYSDRAAIRARCQADTMKNNGIVIFSVGVDIGGQKISSYDGDKQDKNGVKFSTIDRTSSTYEIGSASDTSAYVNWLKNSIGSGYYYASSDSAGLQQAYDNIFNAILKVKEEASEADWTVSDPMPLIPDDDIEFIGFYDKAKTLVFTDLTGKAAENGENTAVYTFEDDRLMWDLKKSGYTTISEGNGNTVYCYKLVYRVRLENESDGFVERRVYNTNAPTMLSYRVVESVDGVLILSDSRTVNFEIPAVHGYLAELNFKKVDTLGKAVSGAEFTLSHDTDLCSICRGDGKSPVQIESVVAVSDENGMVSFTNIPSGHIYTLSETKIPSGFMSDGNTYTVTVSYDSLSVSVYDKTGDELEWKEIITNIPITFELPSTGGKGEVPYIVTGILIITATAICGCYYLRKRKRRC